ncbi:hypothetical protein ACRRTK_022964 [Alexandromys fortis]
MAQMNGGSSRLKRSRLRVGLPTLNAVIKKNPSQMYPATWVLAHSRCSQPDNQGQSSEHPGLYHPCFSSPWGSLTMTSDTANLRLRGTVWDLESPAPSQVFPATFPILVCPPGTCCWRLTCL